MDVGFGFFVKVLLPCDEARNWFGKNSNGNNSPQNKILN
jgi:hypothetical protein